MTRINQLTRRQTLVGAGAALLPLPSSAATQTLTATDGTIQIMPSERASATPIWGYDGGVPGPEIRVPQGGRITRTFVNKLPQPSTIHWHGIRIDQSMDGVPGLSQPLVQPGQEFDYDFTAPDAGTYWYHPHNKTWEQMARGLYGPLIIEEPDPPAVDQDITLMLDDWRLDQDGSIHSSFGQMHDWSHAGRWGNWVTVNADPEFERAVQATDRVRLRLINCANARVFTVGLKDLSGWVVALDGQPVSILEPLDRLTLAPAQRADLIVDIAAAPGDAALLTSIERNGLYTLATFNAIGAARTGSRAAPKPLTPNPVSDPVVTNATRDVELVMAGGARGRMEGAKVNGKHLPIRDLVREGYAWAFNGIAGRTDEPLATVGLGETLSITMKNQTAWQHAMHLHGHHFREILKDGTQGPLRDTVLMQPQETRRIAFAADNPGDWLFHCHMLEHAAAGMNTWIRVKA